MAIRLSSQRSLCVSVQERPSSRQAFYSTRLTAIAYSWQPGPLTSPLCQKLEVFTWTHFSSGETLTDLCNHNAFGKLESAGSDLHGHAETNGLTPKVSVVAVSGNMQMEVGLYMPQSPHRRMLLLRSFSSQARVCTA